MEENLAYYEQRAQYARTLRRVSVTTLVCNLLLAALKAAFGAIFGNVSIISDAVHSASDALTTLFVLVAAAVSKPQADINHNYGHEKAEALFVLLFGAMLAATGVLLFVQSIRALVAPSPVEVNAYLIGVAGFSIVAKELMYRYTIYYAKKIRSNALKADAWEHRSDCLSSVAVLVGLVFSGLAHSDVPQSLAVMLVSVLIVRVAVQILVGAVNQLVDKSADEQTCNSILEVAGSVSGVVAVDKLQTRLFGNAVYVDLEIAVDSTLTVAQSHAIAEAVHIAIESLPDCRIKHCNVHVNPALSGANM